MKTNKTKGLTLAVLMMASAVASTFASGRLAVSPYLKTNYAIVSAVVSTEEGARLAIKDEFGNVLYRSSKIDNSESFQKLIDLSTLPNGTYKVVLEGKAVKEVSTFEVKNNKLAVEKYTASDAASSASFFRRNNDMLVVSYLNPALKSSSLTIYDAKGETVYSAEIPTKETYSALYKINELPKGQYMVALTADSNTHNYEFEK
ncbi:MAG: hypothetical protein QM786_18545 [Breznakibacter sp.]